MMEDSGSDSDASNEDFDDAGFDLNDPDARAERELFTNPYKHKRRKKNAKEDALYGVFGSEEEEEERQSRRGKSAKRSDWSKAPAFVSGKKKADSEETSEVDAAMKDAEANSSDEGEADRENAEDSDDEDDDDDENNESDDDAIDAAKEPEIDDVDQDSALQFGGLGLGASKAGLGSSRGGIGSAKGGIGASSGGLGFSAAKGGIGSSSTSGFAGFSKGGIGSFKPASVNEVSQEQNTSASSSKTPAPATVIADDLQLPSSFGKSVRAQRAFVRDGSSGSGTSTPKPVQLSASERAHFSKIGGTFGARMLEKMGWQAGLGLGTAGEGIVTPVESKLRPRGMGLAFKGVQREDRASKGRGAPSRRSCER